MTDRLHFMVALLGLSLALSCGDGSVETSDSRVDVGEDTAGQDRIDRDGADENTGDDNESSENGNDGDGDGDGTEDGNSGDEDNNDPPSDNEDSPSDPPPSDELTTALEELCEEGLGNRGDRIFVEVDRFLIMEAEDAYYDGPESNWAVQSEGSGYSGGGYYEWFNPANTHGGGVIARSSQLWFNVYISTPGTYIVSVRGRINQGDNDSEHNDVWLKVGGDVADFYSYRRQSDVDQYRRPDDIANSEGVGESLAASRGYLKAYNKTLGRWSYETRNVDFREANIFAVFDEPGLYNVSLAAKVRGFGVDQVVLIGDPAWQTYDRLTNRSAVLSQTADKRHHDCQ